MLKRDDMIMMGWSWKKNYNWVTKFRSLYGCKRNMKFFLWLHNVNFWYWRIKIKKNTKLLILCFFNRFYIIDSGSNDFARFNSILLQFWLINDFEMLIQSNSSMVLDPTDRFDPVFKTLFYRTGNRMFYKIIFMWIYDWHWIKNLKIEDDDN